MNRVPGRTEIKAVAALAAVLAIGACSEKAPLALESLPAFGALPNAATLNQALAELRRATAPYQDVNIATADGFVPLGVCEEDDSALPYINPPRIDGTLDFSHPEALLYEPAANGQLTLAGVELVIPYAAWSGQAPPQFFGVPFQREDEFGVYGLHIWLWRHNPNGMFAIQNPTVSCGTP